MRRRQPGLHDAPCGIAPGQSLPFGPSHSGIRPSLSDRSVPTPTFAGMIKASAPFSAMRRPRAARSPWKTARLVLLILTILHRAALCLAPGSTRAGLLRFVRSRAVRLEHIFRRLLLNMRAPARSPRPAPFAPRADAPPRPTRSSRARPRFLLSLRGLLPQTTPAPDSRSDRQSGTRVPAGDARSPVTSLEDQAATRLKNLQSVLEDCWSFAEKLSRALARLGLRLRAPKTARPEAAHWLIPACAEIQPACCPALPGPDTS